MNHLVNSQTPPPSRTLNHYIAYHSHSTLDISKHTVSVSDHRSSLHQDVRSVPDPNLISFHLIDVPFVSIFVVVVVVVYSMVLIPMMMLMLMAVHLSHTPSSLVATSNANATAVLKMLWDESQDNLHHSFRDDGDAAERGNLVRRSVQFSRLSS